MCFNRSWRKIFLLFLIRKKSMWLITVLSRREGLWHRLSMRLRKGMYRSWGKCLRFFLCRRKDVGLIIILSRWEGMWQGLRLRWWKGFCLRLRIVNREAVVLARL